MNARYRSIQRRAKLKGEWRPGMLVEGERTWKQIVELLSEGFTKAELARRVGRGKFQFRQRARVLYRTAKAIQRLYDTVMVGGEA